VADAHWSIVGSSGREGKKLRKAVAAYGALLAPIHKNVSSLHIDKHMRTNIEIDDRLMQQAMRSSGARTKRAAVEEALRLLVQTRRQGAMRRWWGKVKWEGDLDGSRRGRVRE
jgi:Arc/MetJ family transcription regulator